MKLPALGPTVLRLLPLGLLGSVVLGVALQAPPITPDNPDRGPDQTDGQRNEQAPLATVRDAAKRIDETLRNALRRQGLTAPRAASGSTLLRRTYLDLIGRIPTRAEAEAYFADRSGDAHGRLVDRLIASPGHKHRMFLWWASLLRARDQLNNNVPGGPYLSWIRQRVAEGSHYDDMVRELLTAKGSYWQGDGGSGGYYLRDAGMPLDNMANTSRLILGTRIGCAQCHDHPYEKWTREDFFAMAAFSDGIHTRFRVQSLGERGKAIKKITNRNMKTDPRTRQIARKLGQFLTMGVHGSGDGSIKLPNDWQDENQRGKQLAAKPLFGTASPGAGDQRSTLAAWMTSADNERFTKVIANRLWALTMGSGLVEPIDDWRDDSEGSVPELLPVLEEIMVAVDYDLQDFLRILARTEAYSWATAPMEISQGTAWQPTGRPLVRLSAEELYDSLLSLVIPAVDERRLPRQEDWQERFDAINGRDAQGLVDLVSEITTLDEQRRAIGPKGKELRSQLRKAQNRKDEAAVRSIRKELRKLNEEGTAIRQRLSELRVPSNQRFSFNKKAKTGPWAGFEEHLVRAAELPQPAPADHPLALFGQGERELIGDGHRKPNVTQVLVLLNGLIDQQVLRPDGYLAKDLLATDDPDERIRRAFLGLLGRPPRPHETAACRPLLADDLNVGSADLVWALINSREFLFLP